MLPYLHRIAPATMEENPLWLVVLCDMMTNLMLFFLVMFSITRQGPEAQAAFARHFRAEQAVAPAPPQEAPKPPADPGALIKKALADAGLSAAAEVERTEEGVRVRLREGVLFKTGGAALEPKAGAPLAVIAAALHSAPHEVVVEGYTDDARVLGGAYRSNEELSVARAYAVLERLAESGIPPGRLVAAGYGEFHPAAPNASAEGRALNRRVELLILAPEAKP